MSKLNKDDTEQKSYAFNNTTLFAFIGLSLSGLTGIVFFCNAAYRLITSIWMFSVEGRSMADTGISFLLAVLCFIFYLICINLVIYCWNTLQKHSISDETESEPIIVINGIALTDGQVMTIRCACSHFESDLIHEGLGDDNHGKVMTESYLARLRELDKILHSNKKMVK